MTQATKSLTIIFAILLVITLVVKLGDSNVASEALQSTVIQVDTSRVNGMTIEQPAEGRKVMLRKEQGKWRVSANQDEESYPADPTVVTGAIDQLNNLNVKAVATRNPDKYTRYKVDSTGTKVSLYENDRLLGSIIVGAPQVISRREFNSYVRRPGEEPVYTVEGFLSPTFDKQVEGWRDKTVWELDQSQISRIDFLFPADSSYSLERAGERQWVTAGDTLESGSVSSLLSRLGRLRASGFVDTLSTENFGIEQYAVQLRLDNGVQKTLRLRIPDTDDNQFYATATDYPYVFTLNKSSFENSVLKSRQSLLNQ